MALTLVTFHAHPDDEAIATGGTMALAAAAGHRVVLVVATRGELGEVADGFLDEGETLAQRRVKETHAAAELLGVSRVEFLGYSDSGMLGEATNDRPGSFWSTPIEESAARLAAILEEEGADILTVYDDNGSYGHPDHVQVHRVGVRAAELAATPQVLESTVNRDEVRAMVANTDAVSLLADEAGMDEPPIPDLESFGKPEAVLTTRIDVTSMIEAKRAAMAAHASQIDDESWFLKLPLPMFTMAFGTEWFIRRGADASMPHETALW